MRRVLAAASVFLACSLVAQNVPRQSAAGMEFVKIAPGEFMLGCSIGDIDCNDDERPIHRVQVGEFYIGRFPVTHDEYARFVNATGYPFPVIHKLPLVASTGRDTEFRELAAPYVWDHSGPPSGRGGHPVVLIRHSDALAYCRWMSRVLDRTVRLPTEAEWEKAARGGVEGQRHPWGDGEPDATRCNFLADPSQKSRRGTRPTGTYPPNAYGLYDIAGNVWEWVSDWYEADYYGAGVSQDPTGPETGEMRIVRGGSWVSDDPSMLRCAYRHQVPPDTYTYSIGFRIVCEA